MWVLECWHLPSVLLRWIPKWEISVCWFEHLTAPSRRRCLISAIHEEHFNDKCVHYRCNPCKFHKQTTPENYKICQTQCPSAVYKDGISTKWERSDTTRRSNILTNRLYRWLRYKFPKHEYLAMIENLQLEGKEDQSSGRKPQGKA